MIIYFYNSIYKYNINTAQIQNNSFLDVSRNFFATNFIYKTQIFNVFFLLYSFSNFTMWVNFIQIHNLYLWWIVDSKNIFILNDLFNNKFSFICTENWIPGLLSNTNVVINGSRFLFAMDKKKIYIEKMLDFAFLCSTKNVSIVQEMSNFLIPTIVSLDNISCSIFRYFIPLFLPLLYRNKISIHYLQQHYFQPIYKNYNVNYIKSVYTKNYNCIKKNNWIVTSMNKSNWIIYVIFIKETLKWC